MKKILIISDTVKRKTGYATVARNLIKNLSNTGEYEFAQLGLADLFGPLEFEIDYYSQVKNHTQCCNRGPVIEFTPKGKPPIQYLKVDPSTPLHDNQTVCPHGKDDGSDQYAYTSIYFVIQHFKPDIVMPINDLWGLYNIAHLANKANFKFVPYLAIDSDCMFPGIENPQHRPGLPPINTLPVLGNTHKIVVFTDWAKDVINKTILKVTGGKILNNIEVVPHGVDTNIWKPLDNKQELRNKYFKIKDKVFLVGSIARNQPRKRLDGIFETMRKFIDKYEDNQTGKLMFYFHCALKDRMGWDLPWLAKWYEVEDRCIFDDRLKPGAGPTDEQLNEIVNCFDAHLSLTNSEGWHLPALETAAAGVPNVITNYSAHADWGKDTHLFCKVKAWYHEPVTNFLKAVADTDHAAKQLDLLYHSPKMRESYSKKGIALGKKLDWKNVCEQWKTLLDTVDVSELKADRYNNTMLNVNPKENPMAIKYLPADPDAPMPNTPSSTPENNEKK